MVNVNGMKTKQLPHNFAISIDVILISMHRINNEILFMNNIFVQIDIAEDILGFCVC